MGWPEASGNTSDLLGRRIKASDGSFPGASWEINIRSLPFSNLSPDLAYNHARNEYLVVYEDGRDIYGIRFTGNMSHDFGGKFLIASWPDIEIKPSVAACKDADQYLVTWESEQSELDGGSNIYGRFIGGDSSLGAVISINKTSGPDINARVACNNAGTQYLAIWQQMFTNTKFGVQGRMINPDGTQENKFSIIEPYTDEDREFPALAGGETNYLVAWQHQRGSYQDIHGRIVTPYFIDVGPNHWAFEFINRLIDAGVTAGCQVNPPHYCPEAIVTRAQMAIFLERGKHYPDKSYTPPPATGTIFDDVPVIAFAANWIEQLYMDGITAGCGGGNYCPSNGVTRAQMAIFLLRAKYNSAYSPPDVGTDSGFNDVDPNDFTAAWIKQLVAEGITAGCGGGNYCPNDPVTRAQMAVFLVKTFNLP